MQAAYSGMVPFQLRDGLLFLNKEAHYDLGSSPLALLWKDVHSSRFSLDTDAAGVVPQWQHVVLQFLDNGCLGTGDDPPLIVGTVPQALFLSKPDQLRCILRLFQFQFACSFFGCCIIIRCFVQMSLQTLSFQQLPDSAAGIEDSCDSPSGKVD